MKSFSGTIYLNGSRYWFKVRLPGSDKIQQIPLKQPGMRYATKDFQVAELLAEEIYRKALADCPRDFDGSLRGLVGAYQEYVNGYYLPPSKEAYNIERAILPFRDFLPEFQADEITPVQLKQFRQKLIDEKLSRSTINRRISMIKRMYKWAVSELMISPYVYQSINAIENLQRGRSQAKEGRKVLPVPIKHIQALRPFLSGTAAKIMAVQYYTGMRSSEICRMTPAMIETKDKLWVYRPPHKTEFRGHLRNIIIGPQAKKIIKPLLKKAELNQPIFLTRHGRPFDKDSYRQELEHAFDKAKEAGKTIPRFTPHQIRHTVATMVRSIFDADSARAVLGHRTIKMTEHYAEIDIAKAKKVAKVIG